MPSGASRSGTGGWLGYFFKYLYTTRGRHPCGCRPVRCVLPLRQIGSVVNDSLVDTIVIGDTDFLEYGCPPSILDLLGGRFFIKEHLYDCSVDRVTILEGAFPAAAGEAVPILDGHLFCLTCHNVNVLVECMLINSVQRYSQWRSHAKLFVLTILNEMLQVVNASGASRYRCRCPIGYFFKYLLMAGAVCAAPLPSVLILGHHLYGLIPQREFISILVRLYVLTIGHWVAIPLEV